MPNFMPTFVRGSGVDAASEFVAFQKAEPIQSTLVLGTLMHIRNYGTSNIPSNNHRVRTIDLYCMQTAGWAVFYVAKGPANAAADVFVILTDDMAVNAFNAMVAEASRRKAQFGL